MAQKKWARASKEQAEAIGITPNASGKYRLSESKLLELNKIKIESGSEKQKQQLKNLGLENHEGQAINSPYYWDKSDPKYSFFVKNPNFKNENKDSFIDELVESLKDHVPNYPKIKRKVQSEGHLLVVDPADIHIGKLARAFETGEEYNSQIAVKRVLDGVKGIIQKSNGFNIDKVLFVGGNDILHIDSPQRKTKAEPHKIQMVCGMIIS